MELLRWLLGSLSIALTQLVLAAVIAGIGLLLRRAWGLRAIRLDDCFLAFWVGLAGVVFFLLLWNFVLPVSGLALPVVLVAGLTGLASAWRDLRRVWELEGWRPSPGLLGLLGLIALWIGNLSLGPLSNGDSALYHIQAVLWAEQYPVVPGLANLDGPLAFNNAGLLFDALLSAGQWTNRSNHLANGLLLLLFLLQGVVAGARIASGDRKPARVMQFLCVAPVVAMSIGDLISSFNTDPGAALTVMMASVLFVAMLHPEGEEPREHSYRILVLAALLALAVALKSSAAYFAVIGFPAGVVLWWRTRPLSLRVGRPLALSIAVASAMALAWMGRGVVLSGYPLFPAPIAGFPVEWRAPEEHAAAELAFVVHSGRASTRNVPVVSGQAGLTAWFPNWFRRTFDYPYMIVVPSLLILLALATWLTLRRRRRTSSGGLNLLWLGVPLLAAMVAWFLSSPEPRYARPYFWGLAALLWTRLLLDWLSRPGAAHRVVWAGALLGFSPVILKSIFGVEKAKQAKDIPFAILRADFKRPGTDLWFQPMDGEPQLRSYQTRSGLVLNAVGANCWDAPLPCTPNPAPNLRLRHPPDLGSGFVVDGAWQMENWPLSRQPGFLAAWRASPAGRAYQHQTPTP